jgi:hypothetical protein
VGDLGAEWLSLSSPALSFHATLVWLRHAGSHTAWVTRESEFWLCQRREEVQKKLKPRWLQTHKVNRMTSPGPGLGSSVEAGISEPGWAPKALLGRLQVCFMCGDGLDNSSKVDVVLARLTEKKK